MKKLSKIILKDEIKDNVVLDDSQMKNITGGIMEYGTGVIISEEFNSHACDPYYSYFTVKCADNLIYSMCASGAAEALRVCHNK